MLGDDGEDGQYDSRMAKQKVSVTLSPERLRRARELTGSENLSELLDDALDALVERELERRWLEGCERGPDDADLPGGVMVDLGDVPWDGR